MTSKLKVVITDSDDKVVTSMHLNDNGMDDSQNKYNFTLSFGEVKFSVQHSPYDDDDESVPLPFRYKRLDDIPPRTDK